MKQLLIFLILILNLASCTSSNEIDISKFGYKFQHHLKNNGIRPHFKDTVQYHVALVKNGNTTFDTRKDDMPAQMIMRDYHVVIHPSPIEVALCGMSEGDSLSIFSKFSKDSATIRYDIRLLKIHPYLLGGVR